jgi:16S rRNA (guanine966-N2)-methyltransferase
MKIISGKFGSRKIITSKKLLYRPTKARIRKSLFDSLNPHNYKNVLDLFAGSGILGFEAASRGASDITFVENNYKIMEQIKKNALRLDGPSYNFIFGTAFSFLQSTKNKFDLIFADPPYEKYDLSLLIKKIPNLLNINGKFILECTKNQNPLDGVKCVDYGSSRILTWENS